MMYLTAVEVDPHYWFGNALEQMGRHGIPFYVIEGCALPQRPSGAPPMEETLNVTFAPGSQKMSVHRYCRVPNWDIRRPEPWIRGPLAFPPPILVAINRVSQLSSGHSELNAEFRTSVFGIIHGLFSETFESFAPTNQEPAPSSEILNVFNAGDSDDDELDGPVVLRELSLRSKTRCSSFWGSIL